MPVRRNAREMEEMLPGPLRQLIERPVELAFDPTADYRKDLEQSAISVQKEKAEEVQEGYAEAKPFDRRPVRALW
jgi:hypothetical protein